MWRHQPVFLRFIAMLSAHLSMEFIEGVGLLRSSAVSGTFSWERRRTTLSPGFLAIILRFFKILTSHKNIHGHLSEIQSWKPFPTVRDSWASSSGGFSRGNPAGSDCVGDIYRAAWLHFLSTFFSLLLSVFFFAFLSSSQRNGSKQLGNFQRLNQRNVSVSVRFRSNYNKSHIKTN